MLDVVLQEVILLDWMFVNVGLLDVVLLKHGVVGTWCCWTNTYLVLLDWPLLLLLGVC